MNPHLQSRFSTRESSCKGKGKTWGGVDAPLNLESPAALVCERLCVKERLLTFRRGKRWVMYSLQYQRQNRLLCADEWRT